MHKLEKIDDIKALIYEFLDNLDVYKIKRALEYFSKKGGYGVYPLDIDFKESLDESDEEYLEIKDNQILITRDFEDNFYNDEFDVKGYLDFDIFYILLENKVNDFGKQNPKEKENLNKLLKEVKKTLFE